MGFDPNAPVVAEVRQDTSRAEEVIREIIKIDATQKSNAFVLGDLFVEFEEGEYQHAAKTKTLKEFLKKYNIEISPREVIYRTKACRIAKKLGISRESLTTAGISKVKVITLLDPDTDLEHPNGERESMGDIIRDLIEDAPKWKIEELREEIKRLKGIEDPDSVTVDEKIQYTKVQYENVERVLKLVAKQSGIDFSEIKSPAIKGLLYERIVDSYLQDPNNTADLRALADEDGATEFSDEEEDKV